MRITFTNQECVEAIKKRFDQIKAPCVLRKTSKPLIYTIVPRKGVDSTLYELFIIDQFFQDESKNRLKRRLYKDCTKKQIEEYEKQLLLYNV